MEKYRSLTAITKRILNGTLSKLTLEYEDSETLEVSVTYEYANFYELDYKMVIDLREEHTSFVSHNNEHGIHKFQLGREEAFETEVTRTLLHAQG